MPAARKRGPGALVKTTGQATISRIPRLGKGVVQEPASVLSVASANPGERSIEDCFQAKKQKTKRGMASQGRGPRDDGYGRTDCHGMADYNGLLVPDAFPVAWAGRHPSTWVHEECYKEPPRCPTANCGNKCWVKNKARGLYEGFCGTGCSEVGIAQIQAQLRRSGVAHSARAVEHMPVPNDPGSSRGAAMSAGAGNCRAPPSEHHRDRSNARPPPPARGAGALSRDGKGTESGPVTPPVRAVRAPYPEHINKVAFTDNPLNEACRAVCAEMIGCSIDGPAKSPVTAPKDAKIRCFIQSARQIANRIGALALPEAELLDPDHFGPEIQEQRRKTLSRVEDRFRTMDDVRSFVMEDSADEIDFALYVSSRMARANHMSEKDVLELLFHAGTSLPVARTTSRVGLGGIPSEVSALYDPKSAPVTVRSMETALQPLLARMIEVHMELVDPSHLPPAQHGNSAEAGAVSAPIIGPNQPDPLAGNPPLSLWIAGGVDGTGCHLDPQMVIDPKWELNLKKLANGLFTEWMQAINIPDHAMGTDVENLYEFLNVSRSDVEIKEVIDLIPSKLTDAVEVLASAKEVMAKITRHCNMKTAKTDQKTYVFHRMTYLMERWASLQSDVYRFVYACTMRQCAALKGQRVADCDAVKSNADQLVLECTKRYDDLVAKLESRGFKLSADQTELLEIPPKPSSVPATEGVERDLSAADDGIIRALPDLATLFALAKTNASVIAQDPESVCDALGTLVHDVASSLGADELMMDNRGGLYGVPIDLPSGRRVQVTHLTYTMTNRTGRIPYDYKGFALVTCYTDDVILFVW